MRRLAAAHRVTPHQLLALMEPPRKRRDKRKRRLLTRIAYERGMVLCSSSFDTQLFVDRVKECTGTQNLECATFLPLRSAISRRPTGITKHYRAWCPACYGEALRKHEVIYDRLYWVSAYSRRCVIHNIRLVDQCLQCNAFQRRFHTSGNLTLCYVCGHSLIGTPDSWVQDASPAYGEKEILEIIGYFIQNPQNPFTCNILPRFWETLRALQRGHFVTRQLYGYRAPWFAHPLLSVLVGTAVAHDVSLVLLLTDPELAAHAANCSLIATVAPIHLRRKKIAPIVHLKLRERLDAAIALAIRHELPPSLKSLCNGLGVSTGYARYHFNDLCWELSGYRDFTLWSNKKKASKAVSSALKQGLYDDYQTGAIHSQDELVRRLVESVGVTAAFARSEIQAFSGGKPSC